MNRIEALENVLRAVREGASATDRQAIDSVLDAPTEITDYLPGNVVAAEPYGWLRENMMLITDKGRAEIYQGAGQTLIRLFDEKALSRAEGRAAEREALITYLHGRVLLFQNLYEGAKQSTTFRICNCGFSGELIKERCGTDDAYFAVRCPECRKSVQAFTEEGLPQNWNAVNRKHVPLPPELAAHSNLEPMPAMKDRRPFDSCPDGGKEHDYLESDSDWSSNNPDAVAWLADNHAAIRSELTTADKLRKIAQSESDRAALLLDALQECEGRPDEHLDQIGQHQGRQVSEAKTDANE